MKNKFLTRFSVRMKIVASKSLAITVMDHDTGEIDVHFIDIFSGKEDKLATGSAHDNLKKAEETVSEQDKATETSEAKDDSLTPEENQDLIEEQLEEGN